MKPRTYQTEAVESAWNYICNQYGAPVIVHPTGAGKSWVIAMLCEKAAQHDGRVLVLAHRKELLQQNTEKVRALLPNHTVGIYSAGLKSRDTDSDILVGGIQSVFKKCEDLGQRHLLIVDEAHLISSDEETMYQQVLKSFPDAKLIGLTATPYRTAEGPIAGRGKVFRKVCHEVKPRTLTGDGFLSPITVKPTCTVDLKNVPIRGGEFVPADMERAFDKDDVVEKACLELTKLTMDRKSVLVFCCGVNHAEHVREELETLLEEDVGCVTGHTLPMERSELLRRFSAGELRVMVNCDVLTTGFDSPRIDCVAILRSTMSPGLFAQIVGRGFRIHPGKENCIAEGQRVLTDQGLIEIQKVTTQMKVWDGVDFVPHNGVILRGEQDVISYAGLTATGDHNVWTEQGWMSFGDANNTQAGIAITGYGREAIRESDRHFRSGCTEKQGPPLRDDKMSGVPERGVKGLGFSQSISCGMPEVRTKAELSQASTGCPEVVMVEVFSSEVSMRKPKGPYVEKLRSERDSIQVRVGESDGSMVTRQHEDDSLITDRQDKQRRSLRSGESSSGVSENQHEQSTKESGDSKDAQIQNGASGNQICGFNSCSTPQKINLRRSGESVSQEVMQAKRRVWDILNAGPRHRFTCEGLLVSNCLLLDFGGNRSRHGDPDSSSYGYAKKKEGEEKTAEEKAAEKNSRGRPCINCDGDIPIGEKACPDCGYEPPVNRRGKPNHDETADIEELIEWEVIRIAYTRHLKKNDDTAPPTMRVTYTIRPEGATGNLMDDTVSEWVCFEHEGFARNKAEQWWEGRSYHPIPDTVDEAISLANRHAVRVPYKIITERDGKWRRVTTTDFKDDRPEPEDLQPAMPAFEGEGWSEDDVPF